MNPTPETNLTSTIALLVGVIALIFGCCGGLFMGGAVAISSPARRPRSMSPVERFSLPDLPEMPELPEMPRMPDFPELPAVPNLGMSGALVREVIATRPQTTQGCASAI